jgi:hypothetical protein
MIALPFSTEAEAIRFGEKATPFEVILVAEHRDRLAKVFQDESATASGSELYDGSARSRTREVGDTARVDLELKFLISFEIRLCRECIESFKRVYRTTFANAEQNIERKVAA